MIIIKDLNKKTLLYIGLGVVGVALVVVFSFSPKKSPAPSKSPNYTIAPDSSRGGDTSNGGIPTTPSLVAPTKPVVAPATQEIVNDQAVSDKAFSEGIEKIKKDYPWYSKLPITDPDFFVIYDWDAKQFLISLNVSASAPLNTRNALQARAVAKIKEIGGEKEKYVVVFN